MVRAVGPETGIATAAARHPNANSLASASHLCTLGRIPAILSRLVSHPHLTLVLLAPGPLLPSRLDLDSASFVPCFTSGCLDSRSPKRLVRAASGSKSPLTDSRPLRAAPRKSGNGLDSSLV